MKTIYTCANHYAPPTPCYDAVIYNVNEEYNSNNLTLSFTDLADVVECVESVDPLGQPMHKTGDNTYVIENLREKAIYDFYANVKFKGCSYTYPVRCRVHTPEFAGIEEVSAETDGYVQYFNLQGQRVERPASGTIVIRRSAGSAEKVIIK